MLLRNLVGLALVLLCGCVPIRPPTYVEMTPRRAFAAAVLDGHLFAAGGWNGDATQLALVERFEPTNGRWTKAPSLQIARSQHALIAANGGLWVVGGWSAEVGLVSAVEHFPACHPVPLSSCLSATRSWQIVTHLPTPRREPGVALFQGQIVVAGGFNGSSDADLDGYSERVEAFELQTHTWRRLASLQVPRRGLALVNVKGRLLAIGGYTENGFSNVVEEYDPYNERWSTLDWALLARTWTATTIVENDLVIAGGYNGAGFLALVERIDPQTGQLCHPPPLQLARSWFTLALLEHTVLDHTVLAIGGETEAGFTGTMEQVETTCEHQQVTK